MVVPGCGGQPIGVHESNVRLRIALGHEQMGIVQSGQGCSRSLLLYLKAAVTYKAVVGHEAAAVPG
jgi:hypothetical protein